ncbi:efflux RND transporter periplasmic adaptor subunit [Psychrobacter lutiphocae]|uniref:efflux RND transporter periplasmic adaptor subunit n=1 Tax=Psychrobacter lutiphocae TaxID=540500 RepID=UPI0003783F1A|nr:efflux RND transporter periplasmic adaptor subunit [Psychrobacter lutiphocae]
MKRSHLYLAISLAVSGLFIAGCNSKQDEADAAAQQQMPPATVDVMPVQFQTVPIIKEFSGRIVAYEVADIRPQITGVIDEILYREGGMVEKGQPLYRLSGENYESSQAANQAAVQQALANVETAKASYNNSVANIESRKAEFEQAIADMERLRPLVSKQAISEQQYQQTETRAKTAKAAYESAIASAQQAQANIASAEAAVATAQAQLSGSQLSVDRTTVIAPISGVTERSGLTVGALVNANQAQPLVTISKISPIYVDISQSSADLLRLKHQQMQGELQGGSARVELILEDGTPYAEPGQLLLAEAKVDQDSGAVTLRAIFNNEQYMLLPGMYVKARLLQGLINNAVLLPQSALKRTPRGEAQVYIVDNEDKLQVRTVTTEGTYQGNWIVSDGLHSGDRVVIVGGANLQPEQKVITKAYQPESNPAAPAQGQGPVAPQNQSNQGPVAAPNTNAVQEQNRQGPVAPEVNNNSAATDAN